VALSIDYHLTAPIRLDVQFEIRGFTALLGRSGAGKTSLLKALAGLLPATGAPWAGLAPEARPVGYMPQGAAIFPHLSVLENAAFSLRGPARLKTAQGLLDDLGIGHLAARNGAKISGGEAQRVALARALARGPKLLLLDEPSAALDATTRDAVLTQLIEAIDGRKIPALAATHDFALAGLADWIVLLSAQKIIQQGTPRELFNGPKSVAAAKLLGYQNFFARDGHTHTIRAEDIEITSTGIPATITAIRDHGADLRLHCTIPEPLTILLRNTSQADFCSGQTIHLTFPPQKLRTLKTDD
jgi:ABC-type Fe3+/spermidine/putrescine transport system ATPase subunit